MCVKRCLSIIVGTLMVAAGVTPVHAASIDVTVVGVSGPWLWQSNGLNSSYTYSVGDESAPTIVTNIGGISVGPAEQLTITYLSGTESAGPDWPFVTAQGDTSVAINNNPDYNGTGPFPSFYMPTADYPIYISELVGTFADSSGDVVGVPFPVGLLATVTVPSRASQLQLGVNDGLYSDNIGGFDVQVSESTVPEPSTFALLGFASIGLLAFSRKFRVARMAGCTAIAGLLFMPAFAQAGYVKFSNSTDTISVTGNTVLADQATYEAIVSLNSTSYLGNYVDNAGPTNQAGIIFTAWQGDFEDERLGIGNGGTVFAYSYPLNFGDPMTAGNLTTGVWYDLAYVYDGSQERIYVDGNLAGSRSASGDIGIGSSNIMSIGAMFRDGGISPSFIGDIQSLRISDVARYSGGSYPALMSDFTDDSSTLLLYDFDQLAPGATSITDLSGNGHDGTFGVGFDGATSPAVVVPEPASVSLIGFALLLFRRRPTRIRP